MTNDFCVVHIGIDDLDSNLGGCTTHFALHLLKAIENRVKNVILVDEPNLVRLNPSIPWKTRGNGAVAIRLAIPRDELDNLISIAERGLNIYTKLYHTIDQDPCIAIYIGDVCYEHCKLYRQALHDAVDPSAILDKARKELKDLIVLSIEEKPRGIVGAIAAITWFGCEGTDFTYELLVYRTREFYGKPRCIDSESVHIFDAITRNSTFNNVDPSTGKILIAPHGPDPVLYGVRGDDPAVLKQALSVIKVHEPIAGWCLFRSNQGTDDHYNIVWSINEARPFRAGLFRGVVTSRPKTLAGGHIVFTICDSTSCIDVAIFKKSGLTDVARNLQVGDLVEVMGCVKPWNNVLVIHAEKIRIVRIYPRYNFKNICPRCGAKMKSLGRGKGFRCIRCGTYVPILRRREYPLQTTATEGLFIPPAHAQKHLVKPIERYGREKSFRHTYRSIRIEDVAHLKEPLLFL